MPGVYLLSDPNTGFLKIGRATNLEERLASLRTGNPDLTLEAWFETDQPSKLESNLHGVFGFKRRRGEFFEVALHEAKAKAEVILGWIQSMPLEQELTHLGSITELDEVRDPNDTELALMRRLFEIKSQKKLLELEEELLEKQLKVSIGTSAGLHDFASFKSVKRSSVDQVSLKEDQPEIYNSYLRESYSRSLVVRPFLRN